LPPTTIAPARLTLAVGLYDYATGERLPVSTGGDAAILAEVEVEPLPGELPNPLDIHFEQGLQLAGFSVEPRRVGAGQSLELALFWRPGERLPADYTFFAQLLGPDTTRWASQDLAPAGGTRAWPIGEAQPVLFSLAVAPDTPTGVYPLIVGAYTRASDGGFDRLQRLTDEGRLTDDFITLTQIRVER
jgi:hypothetical protein